MGEVRFLGFESLVELYGFEVRNTWWLKIFFLCMVKELRYFYFMFYKKWIFCVDLGL